MAGKIRCILIGISLGGPNILHQVLPELSRRTDLPIVVVLKQIPRAVKAGLIKSLDRACGTHGRQVVCPSSGDPLRSGMIYLTTEDLKPVLAKRDTETVFLSGNGLNTNEGDGAIDGLFRSTARVFGAEALAVVMSGSGNDGTAGAKALYEAGGRVIAQDQESSISWEMPGSVIRAGIVNRVVSATLLPDYIEGLVSL